MNGNARNQLNRFQRLAGIAGLVGLLLCVAGGFLQPRQFFVSYLFAYLFWLGLALGCLAVAMIHHLTGGRWGDVTRRFLEAGYMTLPLLAVLFVPILFGLGQIYPWTRPALIADNEFVRHRRAYENPSLFIFRALFFFAVWMVMAFLLRKWSLQQDATTDAEPTRRLRALSAPGLVIYVLTMTFASVDWIMSLEPDWYSTMFPVIICIGQILSAFAFCILLLAWFRNEPPFAEEVTSTHFHHLGNLLLTFVMFWTYISFGQLLIIWSGNLPHEIVWYRHRIADGWSGIVALLALFHFFVPFFLLLFRANKRRVENLARIAWLVFLVHLVADFWMVAPSFHPQGLRVHWLDLVAPIGIGGIWMAVFLALLKQHRLVPQNDPRRQPAVPQHG